MGRDGARQVASDECGGSGILLCLLALFVMYLVWPSTRWAGTPADLMALQRFIMPAIANAVVIVSAYLAGASLIWGIADATMDQPLDLSAFDAIPEGARRWRVAHLSDVHVVGERYGFRIESGRVGPRGNDRFELAMDRLAEIHAHDPVDLILITGDMTDAGLSIEWAAFDDVLARHPELKERMLSPARQSRCEHRRPRQSGPPRSPLQPDQAVAPVAHADGDGEPARRTRDGRQTVMANTTERLPRPWPHRGRCEALLGCRRLRLSFEAARLWDDFTR